MRPFTAIDAMARWLVLTAVGAGLLALLPRDMLGTSLVLGTDAPPITASQCIGIVVIVLAWIQFVIHLIRLRGPWVRDGRTLVTIAVVAVVVTVAHVAAFVAWWPAVALVAWGVSIVCQVYLAIRIDKVRQASDEGNPPASTTTPDVAERAEAPAPRRAVRAPRLRGTLRSPG